MQDGVKLIPATELTGYDYERQHRVHLLAYWPDPESEALRRVVVGILHAAQRVVVRDGHGIQPHPGCHQGQPGHGHGAVGIGGVVV